MGSVEKDQVVAKKVERNDGKIADISEDQKAFEKQRVEAFLKTVPAESVEQGLWFNSKLGCELIPGKGYGIVALENIECGERLVIEKALCTAKSHDELYDAGLALEGASRRRVMTMTQGELGERENKVVPRMAVDNEDAKDLVDQLDLDRIKKVVQHNLHLVEAPPSDGVWLLSKPMFGSRWLCWITCVQPAIRWNSGGIDRWMTGPARRPLSLKSLMPPA